MFGVDAIILMAFLAINLAVGLFYSRGVTTITQYAIGDRNFSTSTLVATIISSVIGAGVFYSGLIETYRQGLYFIIPSLGGFFSLLLIGTFMVSRMGEFLGKLSISQAMGDLFGYRVKVITALISIVLSIGTLGNQFKVAAKMLEVVFGASGLYAMFFSSGIIILYSAFGGIKSVTLTDVIQFFTFGAIVPVIVFVIWGSINDPRDVFSEIIKNPSFDINKVFDLANPKFYKMLGVALIFFLPVFEPIIFQRISMSKSIEQAAKSFKVSGIIYCVIHFFLISIAILLFFDNSSLNPNDLIPYIMNHYAYTGFKGLVAVGIMAIIMSTADSIINSTAVIFAHDLCKPLGIDFLQNELKVSRIFALTSGLVAIFFAVHFASMIELIILTFGLYASVVSIPFIFAIFGFRSSEKSVLIGMIAGAITFCIWEFEILRFGSNLDGCIPGVLANVICLFASHYLLKQPGGWVGIKDKQSFENYQRERRNKRQEFLSWIFSFRLGKFLQQNLPTNQNIYHLLGFISAFMVMINDFSILITTGDEIAKYTLKTMIMISGIAWIISSYFIIFPILSPAFKKHEFSSFVWSAGVFFILICSPSAFLILSNFATVQVLIFAVNMIAISFLFNFATALCMIASGVWFVAFCLKDYLVLDQTLQVQIYLAFIMLVTILFAIAGPKQKAYIAQEKRYAKLDDVNRYMVEAIKNLNVEKQEFINNLSYEIRTPIYPIGHKFDGFYTDSSKYSPQQMEEFAKMVYKGYQNAVKYIDNLLYFSSLSSKNFVDIARDAIGEFEELYLHNSDLQIACQIDVDDLQINCDEEKIKKLIMSLLDNALQFGRESAVEIHVAKSVMADGAACAHFTIRDFGIGIPENELVYIFGAFIQSSYTKTISSGKGIGLALCQQIVSMHQGAIWAKNNHGNKGASFHFTIPLL